MRFNFQDILKRLSVFLLVVSLCVTSVGMTTFAMHSKPDDSSIDVEFSQDQEKGEENAENKKDNLKLAATEQGQLLDEVSESILSNDIASASNAKAATIVTTEKELVTAIKEADDGDVIEIGGDIYLSETVFISTSLTIKGDESGWQTIFAPENARHFYVSGKGVTLTIQNLELDGQNIGGGIESYGEGLILYEASIIDCYVSGNGGGVYITGTLTMIESYLERNNATGNGGAIYSTANSVLKFMEADFFENKAANGGAIYAVETTIYADEEAFFDENRAVDNGGAIYVESGKMMSFEEMGFAFGDNRATNGGAIYALNSDIYVGVISFWSNRASINGGAIYSDSGTIVFKSEDDENFFEENRAVNGGAIYAYNTEMVFSNADFFGNRATGNGGAIYVDASTMMFEDRETECYFNENRATDSGGVLYALNSEIDFPSNAVIEGNIASKQGGGIYVYESKIRMKQAEIAYNAASIGGSIYGENSQIDIEDSLFSDNRALTDGGGIYVNSLETLRIYGETEFEANEAQYGIQLENDYYIGLHNELIAPTVSWTEDYDYVYNNFDVGFLEEPLETHTVTVVTQYTDNIIPNQEKVYHVYAGAEFQEQYDCLDGYELAGSWVRSVSPAIDGVTQTIYIERVERDYTITVYLTRKMQTINVTLHYLDGVLADEMKSYQVLYGDDFAESYEVLEGYVFAGDCDCSGVYVDAEQQIVYIDNVSNDYDITICLKQREHNITVIVQYPSGTIEDQVFTYVAVDGESFEELFTVVDGYRPVAVQLEVGMAVFFWSQTVYAESVTKDMVATIICQ